MALSHHGNFVVTGSHDKSIRVWEKLDEPVCDLNLLFDCLHVHMPSYSSSLKRNVNGS
jgi:WD40 repeat protein